jgi:hypothetical protein
VERALEAWDEAGARLESAAVRARVAEPLDLTGPHFLSAARVPQEFDLDPALPLFTALRRGIALDAGITILVGRSNSGKTTLLNALAERTSAHRLSTQGKSALSSEIARKLEVIQTDRSPDPVLYYRGSYAGFDRIRKDSWLYAQTGGSPNCLFLLDDLFLHDHPGTIGNRLEEMEELVDSGCQFVITGPIPVRQLPPSARVVRIDRPRVDPGFVPG